MSRWTNSERCHHLGLYAFVFSAAFCLTGVCPAQPIGRFSRLPSVEHVSEDTLQTEGNDEIRFAAGAVHLSAPAGWWVRELPFGREVRLVLSPEGIGQRVPIDSIWLCYHVQMSDRQPPESELQSMLSERLRRLTDTEATLGAPIVFQFGPWTAVAQEFISQAADRPVTVKGRHVLVRTEWGMFELHASAPAESFEQRAAAWAEVWASLQLNAPTQPASRVTTRVPEATSILGSWKSYRSRMRLRPDGTITVVPDSEALLSNGGTPEVVDGKFEAAGDLLFVTWRDGSRLNLRWRSRGNDLLLTDHEGQISQLKRLLE